MGGAQRALQYFAIENFWFQKGNREPVTHNTVHPPGALGRTPRSATSSVLQKRLDPLRPGMRMVDSPHRAAEAGPQPIGSGAAAASSLVWEPRAGRALRVEEIGSLEGRREATARCLGA